ncbi:MAG: hypothetical protein LBF84_03115 [Holosporales bacterium]|jgi:hypothetical protein|nr:hypothetical protein [Holosporales bacterium]
MLKLCASADAINNARQEVVRLAQDLPTEITLEGYVRFIADMFGCVSLAIPPSMCNGSGIFEALIRHTSLFLGKMDIDSFEQVMPDEQTKPIAQRLRSLLPGQQLHEAYNRFSKIPVLCPIFVDFGRYCMPTEENKKNFRKNIEDIQQRLQELASMPEGLDSVPEDLEPSPSAVVLDSHAIDSEQFTQDCKAIISILPQKISPIDRAQLLIDVLECVKSAIPSSMNPRTFEELKNIVDVFSGKRKDVDASKFTSQLLELESCKPILQRLLRSPDDCDSFFCEFKLNQILNDLDAYCVPYPEMLENFSENLTDIQQKLQDYLAFLRGRPIIISGESAQFAEVRTAIIDEAKDLTQEFSQRDFVQFLIGVLKRISVIPYNEHEAEMFDSIIGVCSGEMTVDTFEYKYRIKLEGLPERQLRIVRNSIKVDSALGRILDDLGRYCAALEHFKGELTGILRRLQEYNSAQLHQICVDVIGSAEGRAIDSPQDTSKRGYTQYLIDMLEHVIPVIPYSVDQDAFRTFGGMISALSGANARFFEDASGIKLHEQTVQRLWMIRHSIHLTSALGRILFDLNSCCMPTTEARENFQKNLAGILQRLRDYFNSTPEAVGPPSSVDYIAAYTQGGGQRLAAARA